MKGTCLVCLRKLPWEFNPNRQTCPKCARSLAFDNSLTIDELAQRRQKRRSDQQEAARAFLLFDKYGLTLDEYDQMAEAQDGVCGICKQPSRRADGLLYVDHDHETGSVRGLLCSNCNTGIGMLGDDPWRIRSAADYVERTAAVDPIRTESPVTCIEVGGLA